MSAYSEVGLVFRTKKDYELFCKYFTDNNINRDDYHNDQDAIKYEKGKQILLTWDNVNHFSKDVPIVKALSEIDEDNYYLVEACYDYPGESLVLGEFEENAFNLEREVTVRIVFED